ncbi:MAG TPA: hypothetical protein VHD36_12050 [Pirellulales bacterium]|nr:hypothetical protein [Pirellulales bacterium]
MSTLEAQLAAHMVKTAELSNAVEAMQREVSAVVNRGISLNATLDQLLAALYGQQESHIKLQQAISELPDAAGDCTDWGET